METEFQSPEFGPTGRYLVVLRDDTPSVVSGKFYKKSGLAYLTSHELPIGAEKQPFGSLMHFPKLGVALIDGAPDQIATASTLVESIEPEGHMFLQPPTKFEEADVADACIRNEKFATWGLMDTGVFHSRFTGNGVKLAVLDSGINTSHPAFVDIQGRDGLICQPFFGSTVDDQQGHGSHCAGILFGSGLSPEELRFGIAQSSVALVGRVFQGKSIPGVCGAPDGEVLKAIKWAVDNECAVVSMSFGRPPICTREYSPAYETVAQNALVRGTLLVAAAGNESRRFPDKPKIAAVHEPANCPSVMAVGAIDTCGQLAYFSNGGGSIDANKVDICGPGVGIQSAFIAPDLFNRGDGTSVATPFVAGVAALWAEACGLRGPRLWELLKQKALPLVNEQSKDIGVGLVRAPLDHNYGGPSWPT